ncbi:hypothetical protein DES53_104412 [Roseimicrobium gellanilyticum]|uniref:DUF4175 family protein n=1 Tax=Roseimicrobium gellanilyticum TaxID=748857 RepID=A0A366HQ45_9BACT|nr:hypothetical protein [Roseimicrobium gellanilyticum]RBP44590.1 hypothetical protein DES53_104412 [Roseimicrobium gellanilyticum]
MTPPLHDLFDQAPVHAIVKRRGFINRTTAMLSGAAVLLGSILMLALLDMQEAWGESLRLWLISITAASALVLAVWLWLSGRKGNDPETVVRAMEAADPACGQQLRTAWEVAQRGVLTSSTDEHQHFTTRLLSEAQQQVSGRGWDSLAPSVRMVRGIAVCAFLAVLVLVTAWQSPEFRTALHRIVMPLGAPTYTTVAWQSLPTHYDDRHPPRVAVLLSGRAAAPELQVREAGTSEWQTHSLNALSDGRTYDAVLTSMTGDIEMRVSAGDGGTSTHVVQYRPIPRLEESKVAIRFPDYTGVAPEERQGADASVVEGSALDWTFRFNTPPDRVEWTLASDTSTPEKLPLKHDGSTVQASWKAPLGKYSGVLTIYDKEGATVDSWRYEVVGAVDKLPTVELLEPMKDRQATCVTELPVRIRARDDFGVAEVGLIMEAAGQTIWTLEKVITEKDQHDVSELTRAMLETVPLTIRDNVKLYAYALDHKPRGGPRSVSPLRCIDIRDFKKLEIQADGGKPPPMEKRQFAKLNQLIRAQRVIVSDCHVLKEDAKNEQAEGIGPRCQETDVKQQDVIVKTNELHAEWAQKSGVPQDDLALLLTAAAQMGDTSRYLQRTLTEQAHPASDRALGSLLQIRKHLILIHTPFGDESDPDEEDDSKPKPLEELAKEAERLANEEKSVREQIAPGEKKAVAPLESSRRQQEVAATDAGELFSAIVAHPRKNEQMLKLMAAAETFMRDADERLHTREHLTAQQPLTDAEHHLRDLSDFIRAMIEEKLAETLKQMAAKAQSDSKSGKGEGQGKGSGEGEGEGKSSGQGKSAGEQPAELAANGKDKGESSGQGKGAGKKPGEVAANTQDTKEKQQQAKQQALKEAARNAGLADEILKALAELAAERGKGESQGQGKNGEQDGTGTGLTAAELAALRARAGTETLAKDLKQLAEGKVDAKGGNGKGDKPGDEGTSGDGAKPSDQPQPGTDSPDGKDIAARLDQMAKALNAEAGRLNASRLAHLADVREKAKGLRDKAAKEAEAARAAEERQLIEKLLAQGMQPGQTVNINGKKITIPAQPMPGSGPGAGTESKEAKPGPGTPRAEIERFAAEAQRLGDDTITGLASQLATDVPLVTAFDGIIERLDQLMATLPGSGTVQAAQSRVPEHYRREIEAYFRNLSDDFGNEPQ